MTLQFTSTELHRMTLGELQVLHHRISQLLAASTSGSATDRDLRGALTAVQQVILSKRRSLAPRF